MTTPVVIWLSCRGHSRAGARKAVVKAGGDKLRALKALLGQLASAEAASATATDDEAISEARAEEKEVLSAIFEEDENASLAPTEGDTFDAILPVAFDIPDRYESRDPKPLVLEVYVDGGLSRYPFEAPVIALIGGGLPKAGLAAATKAVYESAVEKASSEDYAGEAALYDFITLAGEEAEKYVEDETARLLKKKTELAAAQAAAAPPVPPKKKVTAPRGGTPKNRTSGGTL